MNSKTWVYYLYFIIFLGLVPAHVISPVLYASEAEDFGDPSDPDPMEDPALPTEIDETILKEEIEAGERVFKLPGGGKIDFNVNFGKILYSLYKARKGDPDGKLSLSSVAWSAVTGVRFSVDEIKILKGLKLQNIRMGPPPTAFRRGFTLVGEVNIQGVTCKMMIAFVDPFSKRGEFTYKEYLENWKEKVQAKKMQAYEASIYTTKLRDEAKQLRAETQKEIETQEQRIEALKEQQEKYKALEKEIPGLKGKIMLSHEARQQRLKLAERAEKIKNIRDASEREAAEKELQAEGSLEQSKAILTEAEKKEKAGPRRKRSNLGVSITIALPERLKVADIPDKLIPSGIKKAIGQLSLPSIRIIVSNVDYKPIKYDLFGERFGDYDDYDPRREKMVDVRNINVKFSDQFSNLEKLSVSKGVNILSSVDLAGPLDLFKKLINEATKNKLNSVIIEGDEAVMYGMFKKDLSELNASITLPFRFGVDLTKISAIPKSVTDVLSSFSTELVGLRVNFKNDKPIPKFYITSGIRIGLGEKREPFVLTMGGILAPPTQFGGWINTDNQLKIKMFTIGEVGLQLMWDVNVLPAAMAMGIPFTGIGVRGGMRLGEPKEGETRRLCRPGKRTIDPEGGMAYEDEELGTIPPENEVISPDGTTVLCMTAFANVTQADKKMVEFLFEGLVREIKFTEMIKFFASLVKKPLKTGDIPVMTLKKGYVYVAPEGVEVMGKYYPQGVEMDVEIVLGAFHGGIKLSILTTESAGDPSKKTIGSMQYRGFCKPINASWIKLTSADGRSEVHGTDKKVFDGPYMEFFISADPSKNIKFDQSKDTKSDPFKDIKSVRWGDFRLVLDGRLQIPKIKFDSKTQLVFKNNVFVGTSRSTIANLFDAEFTISIDAISLAKSLATEVAREMGDYDFGDGGGQREEDLFVAFKFDQKFGSLLADQIRKIEQQAKQEIAKLGPILDKAQQELAKAKASFAGKASEELESTNRKIKELENRLNKLKKECKKGKVKSCFEVVDAGTKLAAQKTYKETLLKPGTKVVTGATDIVNKLTKEIDDAEVLQKAAIGIVELTSGILSNIGLPHPIDIRKAAGEIRGVDIRAGKLPRLVDLEIAIRNPLFVIKRAVPQLRKTGDSIIITLHDLQFDFNNPEQSASEIAKQLLENLKANVGIG